MESMIKGIQVLLYEPTKTGEDAFKNPVYEEIPVAVDNVLVTPAESTDIVADLQLHGKKAVYELCIPKTDTHVWEDRTVEFFGHKWKTFGFCQQLITANVPLDWDRKIKVERYG